MPQPFNYGLSVPDPTQNMMNAVTLGNNLAQLRERQLQGQQAKLAIDQHLQLNTDLSKVSANPTPAAVAQLMVKYPQLSEQFKRGYDALSTEQQKSKVDMGSQVYAALLAGDNDTASSTLKGYAEAYRNSGQPQDADAADHMAELIQLHPETAKTTAGLWLASAMGPDHFQETFSKLESERRERDLEPSKLTEAQSAAREAAVKANFAESNAVMDLQKKGWDIYQLQQNVEIARQNSRTAALTAAAARETNDLKRQELNDKLKDAQDKRDQTVRDQVAAVSSQRATIDNTLGIADRILKNPSLNDVLGSLEGGWVGAARNVFSDEAQNAIADIENLGGQAAINKMMELKASSASGSTGFGALSEKELGLLINSMQSLSRKQGEGQFTANVKEVQRLLLKARKNIVAKTGMPDTIPDTPNVQTSPTEVQAIVQKYLPDSGGGTRAPLN